MWQSSNTIRAGHMPHIALRCLEGSTMSNLVHRRRRCARIDLHSTLCLEGSTMSNLVHRRRRCARIDLHSTLCLEGSTPEDGFFFYHGFERIGRIGRIYGAW